MNYRRGDAAPLSAIELVGLDVPFTKVEDNNEVQQEETTESTE